MIINFHFWQQCRFELRVLIAGKSSVTFDSDFEQL